MNEKNIFKGKKKCLNKGSKEIEVQLEVRKVEKQLLD